MTTHGQVDSNVLLTLLVTPSILLVISSALSKTGLTLFLNQRLENSYAYVCVCVWFCMYIQGDSGGICITLGNDSMSDSKQKSSYEHGSDFERLRSYGHFLIPVHALM